MPTKANPKADSATPTSSEPMGSPINKTPTTTSSPPPPTTPAIPTRANPASFYYEDILALIDNYRSHDGREQSVGFSPNLGNALYAAKETIAKYEPITWEDMSIEDDDEDGLVFRREAKFARREERIVEVHKEKEVRWCWLVQRNGKAVIAHISEDGAEKGAGGAFGGGAPA